MCEWFEIFENGQGCLILWLFNVCINGALCEMGWLQWITESWRNRMEVTRVLICK